MTAESDSDAIRIFMRIPLLGRTEPRRLSVLSIIDHESEVYHPSLGRVFGVATSRIRPQARTAPKRHAQGAMALLF